VSGLSAIIALTGVLTGFTLQVIVDGVLEYGRAKEVTGIGSIVYEIARIARELGIQDSRFNLISVVCGGMILIYIFQHLFALLRGILFSTLCRRFNKIMVRKFFDHIIGMPYTSFQTQKAADSDKGSSESRTDRITAAKTTVPKTTKPKSSKPKATKEYDEFNYTASAIAGFDGDVHTSDLINAVSHEETTVLTVRQMKFQKEFTYAAVTALIILALGICVAVNLARDKKTDKK